MKPAHYETLGIDVYEFALANNLSMLEGNIVKYVCRKKGDASKRLDDLKKARATLNRLISYEASNLILSDHPHA